VTDYEPSPNPPPWWLAPVIGGIGCAVVSIVVVFIAFARRAVWGLE
jgi:hypothetical protein